jgi:hypothetical protein
MQRGTHQSDAAREKISQAQKARWEREHLSRDFALKALAYRADPTAVNKAAVLKAMADLDEADNTVAGAVSKALAGRTAVVNLLASDKVAKSTDDPDTATVGERIRLRHDGKTEFPKVELNTAASALKRKPPKLNAPGLYPAEEG